MVSDEELVDRLRDILRSSDLDTTTAGAVRRSLEEEFAVDLYCRRGFIRDQIDLFLNTHVAAEAEPLNDAVREEDKEEREQESENEKEIENGSSGSHQEEEDDDDEEEEEESDGDDKKRKKQRPSKVGKDVTRKGRGFSKPCALSPQLQELVGEPELARTEVVKRIWAHIREKNLQNPKNKRKILCDESLHAVFKVKTIDMFQMNKALSKHIWPIEEEEAAPAKTMQKKKRHKRTSDDEAKQKEKWQKAGSSGFHAPLPLSDALVKFFGTGEIELSRVDVVKRMWQYIRENDLQDPSDKRRILCDDKLKELFDVDSFNGFTVTKLLTSHFVKPEG